jgi:hypothetical protein
MTIGDLKSADLSFSWFQGDALHHEDCGNLLTIPITTEGEAYGCSIRRENKIYRGRFK